MQGFIISNKMNYMIDLIIRKNLFWPRINYNIQQKNKRTNDKRSNDLTKKRSKKHYLVNIKELIII